MILAPFTYKALITAVTDGYKDKGWGLRLLGCNAREHDDPGGPEAKAALATRIGGLPQKVIVHAMSPDTYRNRLDVQVQLDDGTDLTEWLIANQYAAAWDGKTQPRPVPPWPRT